MTSKHQAPGDPARVTITYFKPSGKYYCEDEDVEWPRCASHYTGWAPFESLHRIESMYAVCMVTPLGYPQFSKPRKEPNDAP